MQTEAENLPCDSWIFYCFMLPQCLKCLNACPLWASVHGHKSHSNVMFFMWVTWRPDSI